MKRSFLFLIPSLALLAGLGALTPPALHAVQRPDLASAGQQLSGSWLVTVTLVDPPPGMAPAFLSLQTFLPSGEVLEDNSLSLIRGPGHGHWLRTGDRQFTRGHVFFVFDATHTYIGTRRITATIHLAANLNEFEAIARAEVFDPAGNLVAILRSTEHGARLPVPPPPDQPSQR